MTVRRETWRWRKGTYAFSLLCRVLCTIVYTLESPSWEGRGERTVRSSCHLYYSRLFHIRTECVQTIPWIPENLATVFVCSELDFFSVAKGMSHAICFLFLMQYFVWRGEWEKVFNRLLTDNAVWHVTQSSSGHSSGILISLPLSVSFVIENYRYHFDHTSSMRVPLPSLINREKGGMGVDSLPVLWCVELITGERDEMTEWGRLPSVTLMNEIDCLCLCNFSEFHLSKVYSLFLCLLMLSPFPRYREGRTSCQWKESKYQSLKSKSGSNNNTSHHDHLTPPVFFSPEASTMVSVCLSFSRKGDTHARWWLSWQTFSFTKENGSILGRGQTFLSFQQRFALSIEEVYFSCFLPKIDRR